MEDSLGALIQYTLLAVVLIALKVSPADGHDACG